MSEESKSVIESTPELDRLLKERKFLGWRMLRMLFENVIIFAVPAGVAVWLGIKYEMLIPALVVAFILSWVIFFTNYNQILRRINDVEAQIKAERERSGIPEPEAPGFPPRKEDEEGEDEEEEG